MIKIRKHIKQVLNRRQRSVSSFGTWYFDPCMPKKKLISFEKTGLILFVPDGLLKALYAVQGNGMPSGS